MKKLKPILLAAAALGGLALMAAAALLDLPGGITGLMCGLAAWIMTSRLMACDATYGDGAEMDAIAAAVIGGTSMSGGKGTLWGTIIGVFLVGFLRNALNILGVNPYWQGTAIGAVIVIAVLAEKLSKLKVKKSK